MNIKNRISDLERMIKITESPFVSVSLADKRRGIMLWPDAVLAAIDGKIETVETESALADLVRMMMIDEVNEL